MTLHEISVEIINNMDIGWFWYAVFSLVYLFFMALSLILGPKALKKAANNNAAVLRVLMWIIIFDTIVVVTIFAYEIFFGSLTHAILTPIFSYIVAINGGGWAAFVYLFRLKADTNRVFSIKLYALMMFFIFIGYLSHLFMYVLVYEFAPNIITFCEYHSLMSVAMSAIIITGMFIKSVFTNKQTFAEATLELSEEMESALSQKRFFSKIYKTK